MNNEMPLVTVLMTSYNREKFIAEAIESVLASTYENFELIIVDDCSKDRTVDIANHYAQKDKRIKVFVNEKNLTQFPNRNKAAGYAIGKYIKYIDSDDKIYDWGLEYCVEMMEKYTDAGMGIFQAKNKVKDEYLTPEKAVNTHFFEASFLNIGPSGTIIKSNCFKKAGFFKPDYGVPSDIYFNIKMASLFPVVMLRKEFFFYRVHEGQEFNNRLSYLLYNYPCIRDLMLFPELPVTNEKRIILLENAKRSFLKDCLRNIKAGKIKAVYQAFKLSGITIKEGIRILSKVVK